MIIVFGSIYMDITLPIETYPMRDSIIGAGPFLLTPGGKGANQAVAAARTGAKVFMAGMVGRDAFGDQIREILKSNGVAVSGVGRSEDPPSTGVVVVLSEPDGVNTQIASPGANGAVSNDQLSDEAFRSGNILLTGLSLPRDQVRTLLARARGKGACVVLNVSPIKNGMTDIAELADILVMNRNEAVALARELALPDIESDTRILLSHRIAQAMDKDVIITLGVDGFESSWRDGETLCFSAYSVDKMVDTNGAGDCFLGFLCGFLDQGIDRPEALRRANIAAALSCQKSGTIGSYPYLEDVLSRVENT